MPQPNFSLPCVPWWFPDEEQKRVKDFVARRYGHNHTKIFTPDYPALLKKEEHYLFVYGTLKKGKGNWKRFLDKPGVVYLGSALTDDPDFAMFQASIPVVFRIPNTSKVPTHHVLGDLFKVPTKYIPNIDNLESNGEMYKRQLVKVVKRGTKNTYWAWMYLGINAYWADSIIGKRFHTSPICEWRKDSEVKYYVFK